MTTHLILRVKHGGDDPVMDSALENLASRLRKKKTGKHLDAVECFTLNAFFTANENVKNFQNEFSRMPLKLESKIYLLGHADYMSQKLGNKSADWYAGILNGMNFQQTKNVNVLGCSLGRDFGSTEEIRITTSANSFASKLHLQLNSKSDVIARVFDVRYGRNGSKTTLDDDVKGNDSLSKSISKRTASKLRFFWKDGRQMREWVEYNKGFQDDPYSKKRAIELFSDLVFDL